MEQTEEIKKIVDEVNSRNSVLKQYKVMTIEELSKELRDAMKFERETNKKIEEFEKKGLEKDIIKYAKFVCGNAAHREILAIQDIYLEKIDSSYLNNKK